MRDIIRAEKKQADEEEPIVPRLRAVESEPLRPGRRVLIVALAGSEDEQPLEEPPNEFERAAQQGGWKIRDRPRRPRKTPNS